MTRQQDDLPAAPARRGHRTAKVLALFGALLAAAVITGFATGMVHVYDAANAGIVIGPECHNIGFEWRGAPGDPQVFTDSCG